MECENSLRPWRNFFRIASDTNSVRQTGGPIGDRLLTDQGLEIKVRPTAAAANSTSSLAHIAAEYELNGLPVALGATGISLFTDETFCAVEVPASIAAAVRDYLSANDLLGPVVKLPGVNGADLHIAVGLANAPLAAEALREFGAQIYSNGDVVPLPPTKIQPGEATWAVKLADAKRIQPVVVIGAAVRAALTSQQRIAKAS